jgi:hypothetical protein
MKTNACPANDHPCRTRKLKPTWTWRDHLGAWKVRWGFGRNRYRIQPGLYAVGLPSPEDPVLITANYKLTFDVLRRSLVGENLWILVLNTHGINVWCAAGKKSFGTDELVKRIRKHRLAEVVTHRKVVVPQLGAPGISAHEVQKQTGFEVAYGPVRASDIQDFLSNEMKADEQMRTVTFTLSERLAVVPVELVQALRYFLPIAIPIVLLSLLGGIDLSIATALIMLSLLGAILTGTILFPILLPLIPLRSFAAGGWMLGILYAGGLAFFIHAGGWVSAALLLILPPLVSFIALNFTGSTTFTSLSGVEFELKRAVPVMIASVVLGVIALTGRLILGG